MNKIGKNKHAGRAGCGRPKGSPNKITAVSRELVQAFLNKNMPKAQALFDRIARKQPGLALRLLIDMSEFCVPKLARTEHVGDPNTPLQVEHRLSDEQLKGVREEMLPHPKVGLVKPAQPRS